MVTVSIEEQTLSDDLILIYDHSFNSENQAEKYLSEAIKAVKDYYYSIGSYDFHIFVASIISKNCIIYQKKFSL